jgi:hypothetical protein
LVNECNDIIFLIFRVIHVDKRHLLLAAASCLLSPANAVHLVQCNPGVVLLGHHISQLIGKSCPEQLHLEELYQIVDGVILNFFGRGGQVVGIIWWCLDLVPVSSAAFFDDHHCVDDEFVIMLDFKLFLEFSFRFVQVSWLAG